MQHLSKSAHPTERLMENLFVEMQQVTFSPVLCIGTFKLLRSVTVDAAILRFSDSVTPAEVTRQPWSNIYRANFNSKVLFIHRFLIL